MPQVLSGSPRNKQTNRSAILFAVTVAAKASVITRVLALLITTD